LKELNIHIRRNIDLLIDVILVKTENKDCLLFNGRWAGLQAYRQSKMFIIDGTVNRLIMDVLMAINTSRKSQIHNLPSGQ
jgi:hypothetical protein